MNIFRLAGDMTHLLSIVVLLLKIHHTRSCRGAHIGLNFASRVDQMHHFRPKQHHMFPGGIAQACFQLMLVLVIASCSSIVPWHFACRHFPEDSGALSAGVCNTLSGPVLPLHLFVSPLCQPANVGAQWEAKPCPASYALPPVTAWLLAI